jgi:hypothetical protein
MFKTLTAAVFALTVAAVPVLADEAKPHQFGEKIAKALSYLTLDRETRPFTRDAQLGERGI